jgi:pyridoxal phosphate enzyme (YggS family)
VPTAGPTVAARLAAVRQRIAAAAARSSRDPAAVRLVAVSKTFGPDDVRSAAAAGQHDFGENRVQEGLEKIAALADLGLEWHLIGHLQSNKARKAAAAFAWIHSVDSLDLLGRLDRAALEAGAAPNVLIQIDLALEETKHGVGLDEARDVIAAASEARAVRLRGLMLLPPFPDTPAASRPWFRRLRDLRDAWVASGIPAASLAELSMGMSHDFEIAIEEGATIVRVGTAIFGQRASPAGAA